MGHNDLNASQRKQISYLFYLVGVLVLLPERDRPARHPPLLLLPDPQPPQLTLLPRPSGQGCSDLSHSKDPQDFQTLETHNRSQDPGHNFEEQPQVSLLHK